MEGAVKEQTPSAVATGKPETGAGTSGDAQFVPDFEVSDDPAVGHTVIGRSNEQDLHQAGAIPPTAGRADMTLDDAIDFVGGVRDVPVPVDQHHGRHVRLGFKNFLQNFGDESQFWRFW